jgi:integrase
MCATFGLRPHEAFHVVEFKNEVIEIGNNTKTGARKVWACYPEWISEWNLRSISIPKITYRNNKEIGMRFNGYLNGNVDLPFEPYDLRHAWAIRTLEFGWPDSLAAQQMGHSVAVHTDLYHAWITEAHHQRTYDLLMARPDRPRPQSRQQHE